MAARSHKLTSLTAAVLFTTAFFVDGSQAQRTRDSDPPPQASVIVRATRPKPLASLSTSGSDAIGTVVCEECSDCATGLVFPSGDDSLVYYDFALSRVTLFALGSSTGSVTQRGITETPWAGLAAPDGRWFLLVDRAASGARRLPYRLALYSLERGSQAWRLEKEFNLPWLNFTDARIALDASMGLTLNAQGVLCVSNFRHESPITTEGITSEQHALTAVPHPGVRVIPITNSPLVYVDDTGTRMSIFQGKSLATFSRDQNGNSYAEDALDNGMCIVSRIGSDGRINASVLIPPIQSRYTLRGIHRFVRRDGSIVSVTRTADTLTVEQLEF